MAEEAQCKHRLDYSRQLQFNDKVQIGNNSLMHG